MSNNLPQLPAQFAGFTQQQLQQILMQQLGQQIVFPDVNSKMRALDTINNAKAIISHYGVSIKYNMMSKETEILIPNIKTSGDLYNNAIIGHLTDLFCRHELNTQNLMKYVDSIAHENEYHPVKDWIDSQVWDGRSRLQDYYNSIELSEDNPMKEVMMRKWALSLVGALYHNEFSCEGVLTFSGKQGIGKTTWIEEMLPDIGKNVWNKDAVILDMKNKDTVFKALGYWITELGELDATFKRSDIEALKGFITEKQDRLRNPYDRKANVYPRHTVFYATVNDVEFLQDEENRRFWVLKCEKFNHGLVDAGQFWAEMKQIYLSIKNKIGTAAMRKANNEYGWFMTPDERAQMKPLQEQFRSADPIEQKMEVSIKPSDQTGHNREWLNATEILERCGWDKPQRRDLNVAAKWLRNHGFSSDRTKKFGVEFYNRGSWNSMDSDFNDKINTKLLEKLNKNK